MNKILLTLIMYFCLISCSKSGERSNKQAVTVQDSLTSELNRIYEIGQINGFGVAIVNNDQTLYAKGFGFADTVLYIPLFVIGYPEINHATPPCGVQGHHLQEFMLGVSGFL